ncbi:MAG: 1-(5-phosphoribosyl)-5-[(5-phosphoribosylamino)methylideneamino] imidazole-4-carboxamide isomerase [Chloroflexi bacterium]|nr:1-(5-phosphoribosyl)-5-[(5-phosphoribosylamino)methylideneamino] imidazole-4-carboxamide isomerase [Chloroflexota bacterium]
MARFDVLAAIDLRAGRVVRLREGDFARETTYADDPAAVARGFVDRGVRWLHLVDLDGARAGERIQVREVAAIIDAVGGRAAIEVGGGLRTAAAVAALLASGAARAVVGSAAIHDPGFAADLVKRHGPDRIAVALDVRDGEAVGQGWRPDAVGQATERALGDLIAAGVRWFEVTAIARDGSLEGPDLELLQRVLAQAGDAKVIASGGIATVEDLLATWTAGCSGAIVGRALYEGDFDLARAIRATGAGVGGEQGEASDSKPQSGQ